MPSTILYVSFLSHITPQTTHTQNQIKYGTLLSTQRFLDQSIRFSSWLKQVDIGSVTHRNSKQTLSREIDRPDSAALNPFQVFFLLPVGPYLCPEVCSSRPYKEVKQLCTMKRITFTTDFLHSHQFKGKQGSRNLIQRCAH
ncbi:hypothetical protein ATANTOWER_018036 [Ataeniobius toweri]|uniref:Uncharacterized protein n=1 Tax=Ataeniobius toweri TaxID=208326 RepID=A0ABU7B4K0_9TELE|nr:hypothetical protein [Ataeniobius toweri]